MTFDTFKKTDAARKCIYPVIHRLDALGNDAYGGRYYDGDQNVLHVNLTRDIRLSLQTDLLTGEKTTDFDKHITFHTVKYTQAEMEHLQNLVDAQLLGKMGIHGTSYDVKMNCLSIEADDDSIEAQTEIL